MQVKKKKSGVKQKNTNREAKAKIYSFREISPFTSAKAADCTLFLHSPEEDRMFLLEQIFFR